MKTTVNEREFLDAFRSIRPDQFSRAALVALFAWIEEREQDLGEEMELDVIALCCDWAEHDSAREAAEEYGWEQPTQDENESGEDWNCRAEEEAMEWLQDRTEAIDCNGGTVLVLSF